MVGPDFFRTMQIPLLAGRESTSVTSRLAGVAVVSELFAKVNSAMRIHSASR